ncbi:hypothetical protein OG558_38410 [Kribbella sp. NBC_01510]|uniref:hypothetical protein n=1 Tax=Kribbella sp. NBC_01510 TaxID=2903581 RepID=UPI0038692892
MPRPKNILLRSAAVLAVGLGLLMTFAGGANAATPQPVSATELSKATTAAQSPTALRLLGRLATTSSAKTAGKLTVAPDTHAIYALNPAFVRDASAPVATFWYAATAATQGNQSLTVFTALDAATGTWQPVNVASGNTEARMSTAARGALVFTEPQIGAWYALTGTRIRPLNPAAAKSIGTAPITVAAYQDLVATRYSDKLPGTHYSDQGTAGGYDVATAPSTDGYNDLTAAPPTDTYNDLILPITCAAALLLALAVGVLRHRRGKPASN